MGTSARLGASAAVRASTPLVVSMTHGKNWIMRGDRTTQAALIRPSICLMLYAMAAMTPYWPVSVPRRMLLWVLESCQVKILHEFLPQILKDALSASA